MIKAFIFDMDGVIIDSEPLHFESDQMTMRDYGITISNNELDAYVGVANPAMWQELRVKYRLTATVAELIAKQMGYKHMLFGSRQLTAVPGIVELLQQLRNDNIKIGLASSSPRTFIEMILERLAIAGYFAAIVSGEEVPQSKPAPDIFLKAAELLNVSPTDCLVIEDSGHGVQAAKLANMKCIGFCNPHSGKQDLSLADTLVAAIDEIEWRNY